MRCELVLERGLCKSDPEHERPWQIGIGNDRDQTKIAGMATENSKTKLMDWDNDYSK
jgi:hypothetical protein